MSDQFSILVNLDVRSDKSGFKKTEKDAKKAGERAGKSFSASFKKFAKGQLISLGKGLLAFTALSKGIQLVSRSIGSAVTNLRSFSRAIANVNSILPQNEKLTRQSIDAFRDFAGTFATSSAKQADAFYSIVSAGIKGTSKQLATLEAANEAAIAGLVDINESAKVLVSSMNSYAQAGLTAAKASDILFVAVREGQTTFGELSNFLGNVAPVAAAAGLKFEELAGAIAGITKAGIKTDVAVTGIRALLASLIKVTPEAAAEAKRLNIEFSTGALRAKGFTKFLKEVQIATKGNVESLGKLFPNVRALTPILQVVNGNFEDFARIQKEVQNSLGATAQAAEEIKKSLDFKLKQAENNFSLLTQEIVNNFMPALGDAAGSLARWLTLNRESASETSKLKAQVGDLTVDLQYWTEIMNSQGVPALEAFSSNATFAQQKVFTLTQSIQKLNDKAAAIREAMRLDESPYEQLISANRRLKDFEDRLEAVRSGKADLTEQSSDFKLLGDIEAEKEKIAALEASIKALKAAAMPDPEATEAIKNSYENTGNSIWTFFSNINAGLGKFSKDNKTRQKQMEAQSKSLGMTMKTAFASTISGGVQSMIMAMREGKSEFDAFSKVFLTVIGDMAIKMGETLIMSGTGIEALKSLGGAAAIAAGVGLVAIGTIIKASAGGGGESSGVGSGAGTSGGIEQTTEQLTAPEREERLPNTNVEVVVQGSLVQQEELGSFITDTLNETFGKQGVTLTDARFA